VLVATHDALMEKIAAAVRRIDQELSQLRQDLDRLRTFD